MNRIEFSPNLDRRLGYIAGLYERELKQAIGVQVLALCQLKDYGYSGKDCAFLCLRYRISPRVFLAVFAP